MVRLLCHQNSRVTERKESKSNFWVTRHGSDHANGSDARSCNTTISHPHGLGQELFLGPIRIDLFSPDKQLLHQLVPLGVFFSAS